MMNKFLLAFLAVLAVSTVNAYADHGLQIDEPKLIDAGGAVQLKNGDIPMPSEIELQAPPISTEQSSSVPGKLNTIGPAPSGRVPMFMRETTDVKLGSLPPELQRMRDEYIAKQHSENRGEETKTKRSSSGKHFKK
ncbi:hypothetical protein [Methylosarcina fibrata]|jgi:hypothetical protein|uniref:hypothetical protein n=1 Tax=Methylosarcina fibrata TaxID=105972 RepID=UPI0003758F92|nr:hypothetical protein [Methylosarcina fibrata]